MIPKMNDGNVGLPPIAPTTLQAGQSTQQVDIRSQHPIDAVQIEEPCKTLRQSAQKPTMSGASPDAPHATNFRAASPPMHLPHLAATPPLAASSLIPDGIQGGQRAVYHTLLDIVAARAQVGSKPPRLAVVSDLAKDYDDLAAMVLLKELHRLGVVQLAGYVANLMPAQKRAQFARGALDALGLPAVPVAQGLDAADEIHDELAYEFSCSFMAEADRITETGEHLLHRLCSQAVENQEKITLVCLSSLEDVASFAEKYPTLLREALDKVILQGGYVLDENGRLKPDAAAANNRFHKIAAEKFHDFLRASRMPSVVYTKIAAFATPITSQLFADLAATGHPVGQHLRSVQVQQDLAFYERACLEDPALRFQPFMDQQWFLRNKSSWFDVEHPEGTKLPVGAEVVPYLNKVVVYDALAALGACGVDAIAALGVMGADALASRPAGIHQIVGSASRSGISGQKMAEALSTLMFGSLLSCQQKLMSSQSSS